MRKRRAWGGGLLAVVVLLLAGRLALPYWARDYVNSALGQLDRYEGRIGDVDIALWRGAYRIEDVVIEKTGGDPALPFFRTESMDISIEWGALFDGAIVGEVYLERPQVNFVQAEVEESKEPAKEPERRNQAAKQLGEEAGWAETLESLVPLKINRFEAHGGIVSFRGQPQLAMPDIGVEDVSLLALNLSNAAGNPADLPASIEMKGLLHDGAMVHSHGRLYLMSEPVSMDMALTAEPVDLVALNPLLRRTAKLDVKRGTLGLYSEWALLEGQLDGYLKLIAEDVEIVELKEDARNPVRLVWESIAGLAVQLFENQKEDQLASRIPFSGRITDVEAETVPAIVSILKNAFVEAMDRDVDDSINVGDGGGSGN